MTAAAPEPAQCRPFEGGHANAFAATQARLRAEQAARDAEDERLRHERLAARQASQDEPAATVPMTKGRAERELQAAVAALPAPSKAKARRAGRKIGASPQAADEDAKALQRAIDAKRAAEVYRDEPKAVGRVMAGSR